MKNTILISLIVHLSLSGYGQIHKKMDRINDKGSKHLEAKEYEQAISTFTESINLIPNKEAYYNRAIAYFNLQLMSKYCQDIQMASYYSFKDAKQLLNSDCFVRDTSYVDINNLKCDSTKYKFMKVSSTSKQLGIFQFTVYDKSSKAIFGYNVIEKDTIYTNLPDKMPEYPGGENALIAHLSTNIRYPVYARDNGITGNVFVTFIVDETGKIENVKILKGVGGGCDEEAIRVVKLMPSWEPGLYNNVAVPVQYNLPIRFTLK